MITEELYYEICRHAAEEFPFEAVGYVHEGSYHKLVNVSPLPEERYSLTIGSKMELIKLYEMGQEFGLVHSHPKSFSNEPSIPDLKAQKSTGYTFYILGTNGQEFTKLREINNENAHTKGYCLSWKV